MRDDRFDCGVAGANCTSWTARTMIRACSALHFVFLALVFGSASGNVEVGSQKDLPVLALKLVPPRNPFPELSEQVRKMEIARRQSELAFESDLRSAYDAELGQVNKKIRTIVEAATKDIAVAFLQQMHTGFRVKVSLADTPHLDAAARTTISALEHKRMVLEQDLIKEACSEMSALTSIVLAELEQSLAKHRPLRHRMRRLAFLQRIVEPHTLPFQANVGIQVSKFSFPRIADLIQEMQCKRDQAESKERKFILQLQVSLLQAENEMMVAALAANA